MTEAGNAAQPYVEDASASSSLRLLVVEDASDLAAVMVESLSGLDLQITHVRSAEAGLRFAREHAPDMLILDMGLPDADGQDVVDQLRQIGLADLPLIVYTIRNLSSENRANLKLGPTHFLTKSQISLGQLRTIVTEAIANAA